jgi:anti-sigma-K factor RskA
MEPIDSYIRQAREIAGDERQAAIAELQKMAIKSVCPETAVTALIDLWRENFAAPEELAPFAATLLERWKRTYERVKRSSRRSWRSSGLWTTTTLP